MKEKLKLSDLFVEYCEMYSDNECSLLIVQILNFNTFFAVWRLNKTGELFLVRYLNGTLQDDLKNNTLTPKDLLKDLYLWESISEINSSYSNSDIADLIDGAVESGYNEKIVSGKWKIFNGGIPTSVFRPLMGYVVEPPKKKK